MSKTKEQLTLPGGWEQGLWLVGRRLFLAVQRAVGDNLMAQESV